MAGVGVIVVAAGASSRMGGVDKVFVPLLGRPLAAHSLSVLGAHPDVDAIVFVVGADRVQQAWRVVNEGDNPQGQERLPRRSAPPGLRGPRPGGPPPLRVGHRA